MKRINIAFCYIGGKDDTLLRYYIWMVGLLLSVLVLTGCHQKDSTPADTDDQPTVTEQGVDNTHTNKPSVTEMPEEADRDEPEEVEAVVEEGSDTVKTEGNQVEVIGDDITKEFYYEELPEDVIDRIKGKSYKEDCEVPYSELRYVRVLYLDFDGEPHKGELIVNKAIAEDILEIFRELYDQKYPIERMVLVDEYDADDNTSMAADNTSCFNYRNVDGTKHLSLHSYGLAIDINPKYNPYVRRMDGKEIVTPDNGIKYADRSLDCQYYIDTEDACYKAFTSHGFTWGGEWVNSKDYQHFQKKQDIEE